jgi:hypothetical protein
MNLTPVYEQWRKETLMCIRLLFAAEDMVGFHIDIRNGE